MRKRIVMVAAVGLVAAVVAGGLFASNMGFKLNYTLVQDGDSSSRTGANTLSLPYNPQTDLLLAEDLIDDIEASVGTGTVAGLSRLIRSTDSLETYTGSVGPNFPITPGEGYQVKVQTENISYIVVGSHNPALPIDLDAALTNGSRSGATLWSYPYHSTAAIAGDLILEINAATGDDTTVASVSRLVRSTDSLESYTGSVGPNFALTAGEAYQIKVTLDATFTPAHF
jgi:hypothetical protein